ncbi:MAG: type II toxin-antitoxin system RelE/ParE family toxin [Verrucomicrobiota bacterium JB022]|nr:type II toxin-antitoxin system RelE/ParE family toxin [Verrucomicrobiota bacterium JB022]
MSRSLKLRPKAIKDLERFPDLGFSCAYVRVGYRKYPVGRHVIYYRVQPDALEVVRILHQRMDVERYL